MDGSSAAMPSMSAPSEKEKEEHFVSHFPFRAWCEHCVRGKAKAMRHVKVDHSEEQVPVISVDYCFMNSKDDTVITDEAQSKHLPVLACRPRQMDENGFLTCVTLQGSSERSVWIQVSFE